MNKKINKLHEKALRLAYNYRQLTFEEGLNKDMSVTIPQRNLQVLATELYKIKLRINP